MPLTTQNLTTQTLPAQNLLRPLSLPIFTRNSNLHLPPETTRELLYTTTPHAKLDQMAIFAATTRFRSPLKLI